MKTLITSIFISLITIGTLFAQDKVVQTINPDGPDFKFETEVHDFGTVDEGPKINYEFKFTNVGRTQIISGLK